MPKTKNLIVMSEYLYFKITNFFKFFKQFNFSIANRANKHHNSKIIIWEETSEIHFWMQNQSYIQI